MNQNVIPRCCRKAFLSINSKLIWVVQYKWSTVFCCMSLLAILNVFLGLMGGQQVAWFGLVWFFFWIHDWGDPSLPAKSKDSHCVWGESLCLNLMAVVEDPLRPWILILHVTKMVIQGSVQGSLAKVVVMGNSFWWSAPCCGEARLYGNPQPCQWWVRGLSHHHPAG